MGSHFDRLNESLQASAKEATFACGGIVPIKLQDDGITTTSTGSLSPNTAAQVKAQTLMVRPITLRFGVAGHGQTLLLPITTAGHEQAFQALLSGCQPATFGSAGKDVYDENYRRATKLDTTEFCTDFSPYEVGIIDIVAQLLVPGIDSRDCGIRAELYKLNVYSGPSGLFKPHVDTPRRAEQFGSLVVCLPTAFEGGSLDVRHNNQSVTFNWSNSDPGSAPSIQWAAFYSDCEHEVHTITTGHRITLTYNLFVSRGAGTLAGGQGDLNLDRTTLPLYKALSNALDSPDFMPQGGSLGIRLFHTYPTTHKTLCHTLPRAFKGVDMAIYEALVAAKLDFKLIRDVHMDDDYIDKLNDQECRDMDDGYTAQLNDQEYRDIDSEDEDDVDNNSNDIKYSESKNIAGIYVTGFDETIIGREEFEDKEELLRNLGLIHGNATHYGKEDIAWLGGGRGASELSHAFIAYGNQAEMGVFYSSGAFLVNTPSFARRRRDQDVVEETMTTQEVKRLKQINADHSITAGGWRKQGWDWASTHS